MRRIFILLECPTVGDLVRINAYGRKLLDFPADNCSGHYKLDMNSFCDYAVADALVRLNYWESQLEDAFYKSGNCPSFPGRPMFVDPVNGKKVAVPLSQHGNRSHFRNETLNGYFFELGENF